MSGIIFALVALFCWGLGDFFIQRTVRAVGSAKALFFVGVVAFLGLFPFVWNEIAQLDLSDFILLSFLSAVVIATTLLDFEALRAGKIAVIEPIIGLELPLTVGISVLAGHEFLTTSQIVLVALIFVGIMLTITRHRPLFKLRGRVFEKGILLACISALGMASMNFLVGVSSRGISPLLTIWFVHSMLAFASGAFILACGGFRGMLAEIKNNFRPIAGQSILDNAAWVAFALATTTTPTAIVTAISESYIALAAVLGILVNRERIKLYQFMGIVLCITGVVAFAYVASH